MSKTVSSTPFTLGVDLGNPNGSNPSAEATFESDYTNFMSTMGVAPTYLDNFVDYTQSVSSWVSNASWQAWSDAQSPNAKTMIPVIALPMASTNANAGSADSQFKAIASGADDSVYKGILQAYVANGYTNLVFRPGWEMNLVGNTYAGDTAQDQADWVSAYQHIYTLLHQDAATLGANVTVVWNPGVTNYSSANALTSLYPGSAYVDTIGADVYSDVYPYSDGTNSSGQATYHDWYTSKEDTSVAQFLADPVNREHYWTSPAANEWTTDASSGHALSLDQLLAFAKAQGKPFAVPETGAGNSNAGTDVADDAAFPQWLASQLTAAQTAGEKIDFVNIWDSNGGGNYEFSNASDGKPAEAAAWAQYFGAQTQTVSVSTSTVTITSAVTAVSIASPAAVSIGTGADTLALSISEDAWEGNAQFTVSVDGIQIGGIQTTTALHSSGQTQAFNVNGNFAPGSHAVSVDFLNDAYGGSATTDRNLYVDGATVGGSAVSSSTLSLLSSGIQSLSFTEPTVGSPDTLDLKVSEDAWQGDAQYTISINGTTIGGTRTATASHTAGATQDVSFTGNWGANPTIGVTFINDAYGGSATTDRNLYVNSATYDTQALNGASATLLSNGTATLTSPAGSTALTLNLAEDAWNGDAQYSVSIDGKTLVQSATVTALHSQGQSQAVGLQDLLSAGTHTVAVSFLNDAYGGSATTDRNLYVTGVSVNGTALSGATASLLSNETQNFQIVVPTTH